MNAAVSVHDKKHALVVTGTMQARGIVARLNGAVAKPHEGMVLLPATAAFAGNVAALLPDADWTPPARIHLQRAQRAIAARHFRTAPEDMLPPLPGEPNPPPWLHQRQAYAFAREQEAFGLWIAMGGGKSRVGVALAIDVADRLTLDASINLSGDRYPRILVTCPRTVVDDDDVWAKQFSRWAPDHNFRVGGRVMRADGKGPRRRPSVRQRLDALQDTERRADALGHPFVAVVPVDWFWRGDLADWLLAGEWDLWLDDEIHRVKAPGGKAGKFAARLRARCAQRGGLSGTPLPHSRLDAYSIYRALDPGVFGTNYHRFKRRYAITVSLPNAPGAEKVVGWQNEEDFDRRFHSIAFVWERDRTILGTPEPVVIERAVPLTPATWRIYRDLERDLVADVGAGIVTASNALVRLLRMQQTLSGVATLTDGRVQRIGTEKQEALADDLQDMPQGEPVVVFGRFHADLDSAHQAAGNLGRRTAELSGRSFIARGPEAAVRENLEGWKHGRADVLAVQIQAGGSGIDLTRAHEVAYLSTGFSLGELDQSRDRVDRPGQLAPPVYRYYLAEGPHGERTVDHDVRDALNGRRDVVDAILAARKR